MLKVVTDVAPPQELMLYGLAAVLVLPAQSLPRLDIGSVLETLANRLEVLNDGGQIGHIADPMQAARNDALSLMLDLLLADQIGNGVEDAASRQRWLEATRASIQTHRKASAPTPNRSSAAAPPSAGPFPSLSGESLRATVAAMLQEELQLALADTAMPRSFASAMQRFEQSGVGWCDALTLFAAWEIKRNARFREAIFGRLDPQTAVFDMDAALYFQKLFGVATTIAQRFDARLKLGRDAVAPAAAMSESAETEADLDQYWQGIGDAIAESRSLSHATMRVVANAARLRSLSPERAGRVLADLAALFEGILIELAEHLDMKDAELVSRALHDHGPTVALEHLVEVSRFPGSLGERPTDAARQRHTASLVSLQAKLCELGFDYRRAVALHLHAVELLGGDAEEARAPYARALIEALTRFGKTFHQAEALERAVALCASLLGANWLGRDTDLWRDLKVREGDALVALGSLRNHTAPLTRADAAYREALAALPADEGGVVADVLHGRLGEALLALGNRTNVATVLEQALGAFRRAATTLDRDQHPGRYAEAHACLGDVLLALAKGEQRSARLAEAIAAFDLARRAHVPGVDPYAWADAHFKFGSACGARARETNDREEMEEALIACETALQVLRPGLFPLRRAEVLAEIGGLHAALAAGPNWQAPLMLAAEAFSLADAEPELRAEKQHLWLQTKQKWCAAILRLGADAENIDLVGGAIAGLADCRKVLDAKLHPWATAAVEHSMGEALAARARLSDSLADLEAAEAAYRRALELRSPELAPIMWAQSWLGVTTALSRIVQHDGSRTDDLREATQQLERALDLEKVQSAEALVRMIVAQLADARQVLPT